MLTQEELALGGIILDWSFAIVYFKQGFQQASLYSYIKLNTIPEQTYFPTISYI